MAVAYISDADKAPATASSFTFTSFAVSGTNPVIIVLVGLSTTGGVQTVTGVAVSAGLTAGTPYEVENITSFYDPARGFLSAWAIPAPSGTGTITVTLSGSCPYQSNAILMQGADQTDPCPTADAVSTSGVTNPLLLTPTNLTANDAAVGFGANSSSGDGPVFNQTETFNDNTSAINMAAGYLIPGGEVGVTWAMPSIVQAMIAVRVKEATGGSPVTVGLSGSAGTSGQGTTVPNFQIPL